MRTFDDLVRELERRDRVAAASELARERMPRDWWKTPHSHGTGVFYGWDGSRARLYRGPCRCGELLICSCGVAHCAVLQCGPCGVRAARSAARERRRGRAPSFDPVEHARAVAALFRLIRSPQFRAAMRPTTPSATTGPVDTIRST